MLTALQTATTVVSSHELVSCGNGGALCCSLVDTRGNVVSSVSTLVYFHFCTFLVSCVVGGNA